jgi:hypothetical protein
MTKLWHPNIIHSDLYAPNGQYEKIGNGIILNY